MQAGSVLSLWVSVGMLHRAFEEQRLIIADVQARATGLIRTPDGTPAEFSVSLDPVPESFFAFRRNLFSSLFQSTYHLLDIDPLRRLLYGRINQLFRIWVTSADNLLDTEDKVTLAIRMPGESRVMRQVVAIMAADRILAGLLSEAVRDGVIDPAQAAILSGESLRTLLPSAAQEASEEGGITVRPSPEYVLQTIHRLKTGLLFHLPFMGPELIEPGVNREKMQAVKDALMTFALGCQILDDIRDMARDHRERRHNYILSLLHWSNDPYVRTLDEQQPAADARVYSDVPHVTGPAAQLALSHLRSGLSGMSQAGLSIRPSLVDRMAESLFGVLDLGDLCHAG